ncbi:DnaJ domain [Trypanosoma melophagium]|uniref:DnaJ domain n=1 Tax=Trypanosoma melophagium TaxID=715481 RepID=UPI003519F08B|nr:DnaJ domain [Trypanosoma melophagium]
MSENSDSIMRMHGIQLVAALLFNYFSSSSFRCDVLETIIGTAVSRARETYPGMRLSRSFGVISRRLLHRVAECMVIAVLMDSRYEMLQDAALLHVLLEYVQQYRFYQLWFTQFMYKVGDVLLPKFIWSRTEEEEILMHGGGTNGKNRSGKETKGNNDRLKSLPIEYRESLLFYRHCYDQSIPYAVFTSGLVTDLAEFIVDQLKWAILFYSSRNKYTSRWRLLKPYLCSTACMLMETTLMYATRSTGAWLGRSLSPTTATSGRLFWCERLLLLFASPFIYHSSTFMAARLREKLELRYPATAEDEMEDRREAEEAAEEEEEEPPYVFEHTFRNDNDDNDNNNNNNEDDPMGMHGSRQVDLYKVLGVQQSASEEEIRRAYRKAALLNHPDRAGHEPEQQQAAREQMALINQAYEVLSSSSKRSKYDMRRRMDTTMWRSSGARNLVQNSPVAVVMLTLTGACLTASLIFSTEYFITFHNLTGPGRSPLRFIGLV